MSTRFCCSICGRISVAQLLCGRGSGGNGMSVGSRKFQRWAAGERRQTDRAGRRARDGADPNVTPAHWRSGGPRCIAQQILHAARHGVITAGDGRPGRLALMVGLKRRRKRAQVGGEPVATGALRQPLGGGQDDAHHQSENDHSQCQLEEREASFAPTRRQLQIVVSAFHFRPGPRPVPAR